MTNTTTAATVETLTAEVRTLVVGSRQVTLSVAKQLDVVPLPHLDVMGRVRIGKPADGKGTVVGTHRHTGALCLAVFDVEHKPSDSIMFHGGSMCWEHSLESDSVTLPHGGRYDRHRYRVDGVDVWVRTNRGQNGSFRCEGSPCPIEDAVRKTGLLPEAGMPERDRRAMHEAAAGAPLIVLAGLK